MQLKQLIQDIAEYTVKNEIVECAMGGLSLYEINFKENNNYPLLFISPSTNHTISNNTITYQIVIYYIDRLLRNNDNNIDIVNASVSKLQQIINLIRNFDNVLKLNSDYQINNFADTQRLTDCVAGGYVNLSITVQNTQGVCAVDAVLPTIKVVLQNKNVEITENGEYNITFDNGYTGLKEVKVDVNIDTESFYQEGIEQGKEEQKSLIQPITITENGEYTNENGFSPINVNLDLESIYDNGYNTGYNEGADAGYNDGYNEGYVQGESEGYNEGFSEGFDEGVVNGKEEQKALLESITITENGNYTNENGYDEVIVNVGANQKPKLPNGITLQDSSFSTIDMSNWDWSNVYDWGEMFSRCNNLTEIQNFPTDVEILATARMFSDCSKLTSIPQFNTSNVINMQSMFYDCNALTSLDVSSFDTSNVTDMQYMFSGCNKLISLDLSSFNTSNVRNMRYMFYNCNKITSLDLSSFDTSKVNNMQYMFYDCNALTSLDVSSFDTSNVTDMRYMFNRCSKLISLDLSSFDTSKVNNMGDMFNSCSNLTTISNLDITNVTSMSYMFSNCYKLQSITFKGKTTSSLTIYTSTFTNAGRDAENPILYYPSEFADDYQKIINVLPSKWTAVPY